jgi:hypothetical protein
LTKFLATAEIDGAHCAIARSVADPLCNTGDLPYTFAGATGGAVRASYLFAIVGKVAT